LHSPWLPKTPSPITGGAFLLSVEYFASNMPSMRPSTLLALGLALFVACTGSDPQANDLARILAPMVAAEGLDEGNGRQEEAASSPMQRWTDLSNGTRRFIRKSVPSDPEVRCILHHRGVLYLGTDVGLLVSSNEGETFERKTEDDGLASNRINHLYANGDRIYIGTEKKVTVLLLSAEPAPRFEPLSVALSIEPPDGNTRDDRLYIATDRGMRRYGDTRYFPMPIGLFLLRGGLESRQITDPLASIDIRDVHVEGPRLFVASAGGVDVSDDDGATFRRIHLPYDYQATSVKVRGQDVFVGGTVGLIHVYDDRNHPTTRLFSEADGLPYGGVRALHLHENKLYVGTSSGAAVSETLLKPKALGASLSGAEPLAFRRLMFGDGLKNRRITSMSASSTRLYVGTVRGLFFSINGGGFFQSILVQLVDDSTLIRAVHTTGKYIYVVTSEGLFISPDQEELSFHKIHGGLAYPTILGSVRSIHSQGGRLYIVSGSDRSQSNLYASDDDGETIRLITYTPRLPVASVYVATQGIFMTTGQPPAPERLYVSPDAFSNFGEVILPSSSKLDENRAIQGVLVEGAHVYVGTNQGLLASFDGGKTFATYTTDQGLPSNNVVSVVRCGEQIVVATDRGLAFF
jgi:ligand-binding sensor domain-containing protein